MLTHMPDPNDTKKYNFHEWEKKLEQWYLSLCHIEYMLYLFFFYYFFLILSIY